ncbi:MAG: flagellar assembly protein FliH [Candidatus Nitricoxidivorans perseverans]|uniref:Flagellar assembly protein FliH n=1 Tax=Candidatus Nitricoxidivorans perseverans TaxID=2975601 RepID=A0AA49FMW0_9PROT|nr:MAG: flagellar assembly protein FliH [Candidatus Nitricoxidivorans perseverans]
MSGLTAWERWELASFDAPDTPGTSGKKPGKQAQEELAAPTAADVERIRRQAHDEGYREGLGQARDEAARLAQAATRLEQAMADLDQQVADELLALAVEIARQVVRGDLAARPEGILDVVHEALAQLPHQHAAIYLHPDDASLVRSWQGDALTHAGHRIHEDARLDRGDCLIETGGSHVDASMATRWRRVLASMGIESAWKPEQ